MMFVICLTLINVHGSLEDHFLVIRIPWLNKVTTYLQTGLHRLNKGSLFCLKNMKYKNTYSFTS